MGRKTVARRNLQIRALDDRNHNKTTPTSGNALRPFPEKVPPRRTFPHSKKRRLHRTARSLKYIISEGGRRERRSSEFSVGPRADDICGGILELMGGGTYLPDPSSPAVGDLAALSLKGFSRGFKFMLCFGGQGVSPGVFSPEKGSLLLF